MGPHWKRQIYSSGPIFGRINSEWNLMGIDGDGGENGFGNWIAVGKLWKVTPNLIED